MIFFSNPRYHKYFFRISLILTLHFYVPLSAQQINPRFSHFTINDGLSQSLIYCITQDKQGFMWFGTKDGLNRFDGYEFKIYNHDPFDTASLSSNMITALLTDSRGHLWVGTSDGGLNLYDRSEDKFIHLLTNFNNANQINRDYISAIAEDKQGNVWVGTHQNGLFEFSFPKNNKENSTSKADLASSVIHYIHRPGDSTSIGNDFIVSMYIDSKDRLWVSNSATSLQYANLKEKDIRFYSPNYTFQKAGKKFVSGEIQFDPIHCTKMGIGQTLNNAYTNFYEDHLHRLWLGGLHDLNGLYMIDDEQKTVTFFDTTNPLLTVGNILAICPAPNEDKTKQSLWLGTVSGLCIFDTKNFTLQTITHNPGNPESLQNGRITNIFQDRSGCMWIGSNGYGLSKFDSRSALFPIPLFHTSDYKTTTKTISVRSFLDLKKYLLIGSTDGLWKADKDSRLMTKVSFGSDNRNSDLFYSIIPDDSDAVWLTCNNGFIWYNPVNDESKTFFPNITRNGETDNRIYKLYKDGSGNIWCLTAYTFSVFNVTLKKFTHYFYSQRPINGLDEPTYGDIYQDSKGNFWLGTGEGLLYFDTLKKIFRHYTNVPSDPSSLSYNAVRCIVPDPKHPEKYLWIGTAGGGLNRFDIQTRKFIHLTEKDGLPNNVVYGILPDKKENLWMSTNKGISKFNPATRIFQNYTVNVGLQSNEFNSGAFYKNKQGKLFFGGITGFNAFYPENIKVSPHIPPVVFTDFRLFNHSVSINDKDSPLKKSITDTKKIILPYKDNIISFNVAGLDYSNPEKNQYAYKLAPSNTNWIQMGTNRLITFSNLNPGHYVLHVKAANSDGVWNEKGISLKLVIMPPWWRTWWAYLAYSLIILMILYFLRKYEFKRIKLQNRLRIEQLESQKLKELDHLKSRFFANISHEFRTPLTLIMGPLEDLIQNGDTEKFQNIVPEMHRNSKRLLQLINQLLDLSKLDAGSYSVNTSSEDIIPFIKQIVHSFSSLAHHKNIEFKIETDEQLKNRLTEGSLHFYFDEDVIEKIVSNLLSNAFKFTPEGGKITVYLNLSEDKNDFLEIKVEDSGVGIPTEKQPYIFDRFYQVDDSGKRQYEGSGIGLALLKELVDLHQGNISVSSEVNKGTIFYCHLPMNKKLISDPRSTTVSTTVKLRENVFPNMAIEEATLPEEDNSTGMQEKPIVLIVEDQQDVRKYIRGKLLQNYSVIEAENGEEGLETAIKLIPDLVISDVMMPKMSGFELCKQLKTDDRTCHIPVVLLTARAEDIDKMTGLETGADAYLIKPFNSEELLLIANNLIRIRIKMRVKFSDTIMVKPSEVAGSSRDRTFIQKTLSVVEEHISDEQFTVEKLAGEMNISISQMNRKLKAIINQSAQQFIRSIRMQRALDLLRKDATTVSEAAAQTGFEDPGYFTKVFKQQFGCLPSEKEKFPDK